jgi:hypothetical protein
MKAHAQNAQMIYESGCAGRSCTHHFPWVGHLLRLKKIAKNFSMSQPRRATQIYLRLDDEQHHASPGSAIGRARPLGMAFATSLCATIGMSEKRLSV